MLSFRSSSLCMLSASALLIQPLSADNKIAAPLVREVKQSVLDSFISTKRQTTHTVEQLSSFYLPKVTFYNYSPAQAIETVIREYQLACFRTGQTPIKFKHNLMDQSDLKLTFSTTGYFTDILDDIALRLNMSVELSEEMINLTATPQKSDTKIVSKKFNVPLNFLAQVCPIANFKMFDPNCVDPDVALSQFKQEFHLNDSTKLELDQARSLLTVKASSSDIERIVKIVDTLYSRKPIQIRTSTKGLYVPIDAKLKLDDLADGFPLSDVQIQIIMRSCAQTKGCDISSAPSIVSRHYEAAIIEVTREQGPQFTDWGGYKLAINASLCGFGIENVITYEQRPYLDKTLNRPHTPKIIGKARVNELSYLPNSHSMCFKTHESEGLSHYLFITSSIIDATGQTVRR